MVPDLGQSHREIAAQTITQCVVCKFMPWLSFLGLQSSVAVGMGHTVSRGGRVRWEKGAAGEGSVGSGTRARGRWRAASGGMGGSRNVRHRTPGEFPCRT